jgi:glycine dehydrogenase
MPGRLIGISVDAQVPSYRMALGTREQHIKREKATSNICTAQALLANLSGFYAIYHGPKGVEEIATRIRSLAQLVQNGLKHFKYQLVTNDDMIFDTITIDLRGFKKNANEMLSIFESRGINLRKIDDTTISLSISETTTLADVQQLLAVFDEVYGHIDPLEKIMNLENVDYLKPLPAAVKRSSKYLTQDIFNSIHSEHQMLRFLYKLQQKDLSLATAMIPLGSCTMKCSPTTVMSPNPWPEFTEIHPCVPKKTTKLAGYHEMP